MRRLVASVLATLFLMSFGPAEPAVAATTYPLLSGSFAQPALLDSFTDAQLTAQLTYLRASGMNEHVLQWTAESDDPASVATFFPTGVSGFRQTSATDVVGRTLKAADAAGVREYVGLQHNRAWWSASATDQAWLDREAALSVKLADDLWAQYREHNSFAGWYLTFEADNQSFRDAGAWQRLASYYAKVTAHLHRISPGRPVVLAPYFNPTAGLTPVEWRSMWATILRAAPVDAIAVQDGVGAGRATAAQLPTWFDATRAAIQDAGTVTQLWAVTETFTAGYRPMGVRQYLTDMKAVAPYVTKFWSFSWDHYGSPLLVARVYDVTYQTYVRTGRFDAFGPAKPANLAVGLVGPQSVALSWATPRDDVGVAGVYVLRDGLRVATLATSAACSDPLRPTVCDRTVVPVSYVAEGLEPGKTYSFAVQAFDGAGNVSSPSPAVSATTPAAPVTTRSLSAGRSYTTSTPAAAAYPDSGGELTDQRFGERYYDAAWQGRATSAAFSITLDLGSISRIDEVRSTWLSDAAAGITPPRDVIVEVSDGGASWRRVGTMLPPASSSSVATFRLFPAATASGRYVRLTVEPNASGWLFVDEVDVRQR